MLMYVSVCVCVRVCVCGLCSPRGGVYKYSLKLPDNSRHDVPALIN